MTASIKSLFAMTALMAGACAAGFASTPPAQAQWWTAAPADYEECAERVEASSATKMLRADALSSCEARFAARRRPGGGYSYHDFMQNRSFDIAGPNPTSAEQKMIDEHYKSYLDNHRRSVIAAAFAQKQAELQNRTAPDIDDVDPATNLNGPTVKPATGDLNRDTSSDSARSAIVPKPRPRPRIKTQDCASEPLACGWSRISSGLRDIKDTLFGPTAPAKSKRT